MFSGKVSKFSITFILCIASDSTPISVSRVLRDRSRSESESELTFYRGGLLGVLVCCLCSMHVMFIHFFFVFDRWMTTPTPPSEPTDGTITTGCTISGLRPCSWMCCTIVVTRGLPRTGATRTVNSYVDALGSTWTS
jgi:hypothetical protein